MCVCVSNVRAAKKDTGTTLSSFTLFLSCTYFIYIYIYIYYIQKNTTHQVANDPRSKMELTNQKVDGE